MRMRFLPLIVLLIAWAGPASAAIQIHFYSKDFASTFPHAFVRFTGTVDSTGEVLDINYGFTTVRISPAVLAGPVPGMIGSMSPRYVSRSIRHFTLPISEDQYRVVLGIVEQWRAMPQPSYRLNSRNCVFFVAEVATALGLHAPPYPPLMKKPKSYLQKVTQDNLALIEDWPRRMAVAAEQAPANLAPAPAPAAVPAPAPVPVPQQ